MGYATCIAPCLICRVPFSFHPTFVPSFDVGRGREPICRSCLDVVNAKRAEKNLPAFEAHPRAYDVAEESELHYGHDD